MRRAIVLLLACACGPARKAGTTASLPPRTAPDAAVPIPDARPPVPDAMLPAPDARPAPRPQRVHFEVDGKIDRQALAEEGQWCPQHEPRTLKIQLTPAVALASVDVRLDQPQHQHTTVTLHDAAQAIVATGDTPLQVTSSTPVASVELTFDKGSNACLDELELVGVNAPIELHSVPDAALAALDEDLDSIRQAVDACTTDAVAPWLHDPVQVEEDQGRVPIRGARKFVADNICALAKMDLDPDPTPTRGEIGRDTIVSSVSYECAAGSTCEHTFRVVWDGKHWKLSYVGDVGGPD